MGHQAHAQPVRKQHTKPWTRRWLLVAVLVTVACYHYLASSSVATTKAISRVEVTAASRKALESVNVPVQAEDTYSNDQPQGYEAQPLTLKTPRYNLLALRSILQHSNTSWQTTPKEARGYFVQSLIWMQMIDGLRPVNPGKYMSAACGFGDGEEYETVPARLHPFDLHPGDRTTGHGFVFYVDCQLPDKLQETPHSLPEITLAFVMDMGSFNVPTLPDYKQSLRLRVGNTEVPIEITPPMKEKSEFAVCLSPLTWTWQDIPLWQLIEWRMHYAKLGVERVNWYGRDPELKRFVDMYRDIQGSKDTFMLSPSLIEYPGYKMQDWEIYADQDAWYMDCILRNAFSSDFILIIDTDEFIMPDFRLDRPFEQFKDFMRGLSRSKGTIEFDRIAMARPSERGEPEFYEEMVQTQYDCYHRNDMKTTKTLYRAHSVLGVHQHLQRKMYPMPPDIAAEVNPKPKENERYGWHLQHSYQEDVWPKLFHYRWWGIPAYDVCSRPSFLADMPKYTKYLEDLRKEVAKLAAFMDAKYPLELESE